jgi:hypothetical protein
MSKLPKDGEDQLKTNLFPDENLFLITLSDTWYGYILVYLQTQMFMLKLSHDKWHHVSPSYK